MSANQPSQLLMAGTASLVSVVTLFSAGSAQAQIANGGFETGDFSAWNTIGNTSIETDAFGSGSTEGDFQAFLSTGDGAVADEEIEGFLGLPSGSLDLINPNATEGSAIVQTFTAKAGDVVRFDWNFLTNEASASSTFNDSAFVSLAGIDLLADTFSPLVSSFTPLNKETGFNTFSYEIITAGTYNLGLGAVDIGDDIVESGLLVDNVSVESKDVPEPASVLGLLAVGAFGAATKLKSQQEA